MPTLFAQEQINTKVTNAWDKVDEMVNGFVLLLPNLVIATVVLVLICIGANILKRVIKRVTRDRSSSNIGTVLGRLAQWAMILFGLMVAVSIVAPSVGPGELIAGLGVSSVAIGFAFKDILQNFLAGILVLLREPFKIGDAIRFGDYSGTVEAIETRSTNLRTWDGRLVIIPNGQIFTSAVEVITANPHRRNDCVVGIGYGNDIREAHRIILDTLNGIDQILEDPAPFVQTVDLGSSSVNLRAFWWTTNDDFGIAGSEAITRIKEHLDEARIDMPYPTQVTLFHDQTGELDGDNVAASVDILETERTRLGSR